jgi:hypothetical protein
MSKEFTMDIQEGFDFIIEEGGNTSINLRKVSWNGREPKLDLRKWSYQDGTERAMKGVTLSDDGADELTGVLVEQGYGNTERIIKAISKRDGYNFIANNFDFPDDNNEIDDGEYYDPSELLESQYEE